MKHTGEFNEIKITNPDGFIHEQFENRLRTFTNEGPRFIKETPMARQTEVGKTPESVDLSKFSSSPINQNSSLLTNNLTSDNLSTLTSAASNAAGGAGAGAGAGAASAASGAASAATTAASAATTATATASAAVTTTIGSTIGAVTGVVASSVVTAVIVVAVFISTLTINLSLVMADFNTLVIRLELNGAQDEDFQTHIIAVLDGPNGVHYVQNVTPDNLYLTFTDLTPNTEYFISVRNDEKVFVEKSFFTASKSEAKGYIGVYVEENVAYVTVESIALGSEEFYTVQVKDENGWTVFAADSAERDNSFRFPVSTQKSLNCTVSVSGVVYAYCQMEMEQEEEILPEYDYANPNWNWESDLSAATVTFTEIHDLDPLVLPAEITVATTAEPDCETDGEKTYTATVNYDEQDFSDHVTQPIPALGHVYEEPTFSWTPIYSGDTPTSDDTPIGYTATATFTCTRDPEHTLVLDAEVTSVYTAATCEEDGYRTYTATVVYDEEEYSDENVLLFEGSAAGHDYSQYYEGSDAQPAFTWIEQADGSYTATVTFYCNNDPDHTQVFDAEIGVEDTSDCENGGIVWYYASYVFNEVDYQEDKEVEVAPGHHYEPVFHWMYLGDTQASPYDVEFQMVCVKGDSTLESITATVTSAAGDGYTLYTATATYENVEYTDTKKVETVETTKGLAQNVNYYLGDMIEIGQTTTYFSDGFDGAHRSNMNGGTTLNSVLLSGDDGGNTSLSESSDLAAVLDYDRILFQNETYARQKDDDGQLHSLGYYEFSWIFAPNESDYSLIGVVITGGSGVEEDPYILTPLYGVTVTYNANDGVFNYTTEDTVITRYYTADEVANGVYAIPPAENPEASGRLFTGWYTDEYGENKFDFENTAITENITLYAGWVNI